MKSIIILAVSILAGCSFSKKQGNTGPITPLSKLQIGPEDWSIETNKEVNSVRYLVKKVNPEKVEFLRKNFRMPSLSAVTVPESNGFEMYDITGYPELESATYIHPKLYINSAMDRGSILSYRTGKTDGGGNDVIEISIPVAMVNGLVSSIPVVGGPQSGVGAAVTLPSNYRIDDLEALKNRLGRDVKTLPVCPKLFRLSFEGREYWARSQFENHTNCPLNQFFRIHFEAPVNDMKHLLDAAAIREEAVTIITDLEATFDYPVRRVDLTIDQSSFKVALQNQLNATQKSGETKKQEPTYSTQDIELAITDSIFDLGTVAGIKVQKGQSLGTVVSDIIMDYFDSPISCHGSGLCRAVKKSVSQKNPIQYGWLETESLGAALQTQTISSLGSVANSSRFQATPAITQLEKMRRPEVWQNESFGDVMAVCGKVIVGDQAIWNYAAGIKYSKANKQEQAVMDSYCKAALANGSIDFREAQRLEGYFPLGNNTVVHPGAWLRMDVDEISEFTTAKTRKKEDGSVVIESQVIDLLAGQPSEKRTSCVSGAAMACKDYRKTKIAIRDRDGSHLQDKVACNKGEPGCVCEKNQAGEEVCFKYGEYLYQDILDYSCDPQDEISYCPYWRDEEQVISYEIESECQNIKTTSMSHLLCIWGCEEKHEVQCKEKSRKPVKALRRALNCVEDEEERIASALKNNEPVPERRATAHRIKECKHPKYKCAQWDNSCTRYAVNEAFHIVHEDVVPKWRPLAVDQGEYPARFEEDVYLKFISRDGYTASNCRLNSFPREFRGNTFYIKIPSEANEEKPCDKPIWTKDNTKPDSLPKVYIKNDISYRQERLCGRTEYSYLTKEVPLNGIDELVPREFNFKTEININPIKEACTAPNAFLSGRDLWFTEIPAIRFSGRISVLGRMLESTLTEERR